MGENSAIGWTDHTFNPWTGCTKVSPACANCYAEAWAKRSGIVKWGDSAERRRTSAANWKQPLKWNQKAMAAGVRRRVFCASLADVFEDRPELQPWREDLFRLIELTPNLDWLLLTKRPENIIRLSHGFYGSNLWLGTTVENDNYTKRIDELTHCGFMARILFVSCEPLLGSLSLDRWLCKCPVKCDTDGSTLQCTEDASLDWVIVGGESGAKHRSLNLDHVRPLRDQCLDAGVPFFFKQHGGHTPDAGGCLLDGREWKQIPQGLSK